MSERIDADEVFAQGEETQGAIQAEPYEGKVALHVSSEVDDIAPLASVYLSPVAASVLAERLRCAVERVVADPEYAP